MTNPVINNAYNVAVPQVTSQFLDKDGNVQQAWYQFLVTLWRRTGGAQGEGPDIQYSEAAILGQISELREQLQSLSQQQFDPASLLAEVDAVLGRLQTVDQSAVQELIDSAVSSIPNTQGLVNALPVAGTSGWARPFMVMGA